jgi:D-glycero-alpha-D-manno-heptose-7-phosphate kinase
VIDLAARHRAAGWKVNGAGGDGGSITVLSPTREAKEKFDEVVPSAGGRVLDCKISASGLEVRGALSGHTS